MSEAVAPVTRPSADPLQRRAIALVSGGLDSMLAVKVMQEQGIHVEGVNFQERACGVIASIPLMSTPPG